MIEPRLGIIYKNFSAWKGISHIGLGVAAMANCEYLNDKGYKAVVFPVRHNIDIVKAIKDYHEEHKHRLTHIIISAPWISTRDMGAIVEHFPLIQFVVVSHSNVGFLQADPQGICLIRDYLELSRKFDNLSMGGNTQRFTEWLSEAYDETVLCLPNMYPIHHPEERAHNSGIIRIGSFGAIRPLKNQLTAAASSIIIGKRLNRDVEFHLSAGREEGGGNIVLNSIQQMTSDIPNFKLVLDGWTGWHEFRKNVRRMDLLIHPSYTESFNMVTADGISQNVPVVGSEAIPWLPRNWRADSDSAIDIARVGIKLLREGAHEGVKALEEHNHSSFELWKKFLEI